MNPLNLCPQNQAEVAQLRFCMKVSVLGKHTVPVLSFTLSENAQAIE